MPFIKSLASQLRHSRPAMWLRRPYRKIFRRLEDRGIRPDHELRFLTRAKGVIHVGASEGQEAWIYDLMRIQAIWFEPIPEVFQKLESVISSYPSQVAYQALLTDADDMEYDFHVTDNGGGSSSIFELDQHRKMYPGVGQSHTITLSSITLDSAMERFNIPDRANALVLDTQGSELLVLIGAQKTLSRMRWIFAECADFPAYKGGCQRRELSEFLGDRGFQEAKVYEKLTTPGIGSYFDILYERH